MMLKTIFYVFCLLGCFHISHCEDFYTLLRLNRQANTREIRQAFKKLALTLHPDKNRDDPDAHDKFLKINRAYEVLKDEELRKKYDMYGEDGLKEGGPSGHSYQSWNFYNQDFGIYDDDQEIITLSRSDFEQSVDGTEDVWFINFYSPRCSHCHELADTWREVAREMFGVIRIGAVNCEDDWQLCRQKGINSYPTLILYPEREKFYGDRSRSELVKFALEHVRAQVIELWSGNFKSRVEEDDERSTRDLPWLIAVCGKGDDCLERATVIKLAAMLNELTNIATLNCYSDEDDCDELNVDHGINFYKASAVGKGLGKEIVSMDAREIAFFVLEQLPDVTNLDRDTFQRNVVENQLADVGAVGWLVHFIESDVRDLDLRKLPALVSELNVGRVDCRVMRTECNNLHIHKFPTFALFKPGKGHEVHHGRHTAHDIAAFARESSQNSVRVLGPADFPRVINSHRPWFIDFFAPWCPPCMRLLPEFRKASRQMGQTIGFGTVDCTVHLSLCQSYNVRSYPTTILYNQTVAHQFHGHHSVSAIVEFLQDVMQPPVQILIPETFDALVRHKSPQEIWLVDFYAPWCGPCQQLSPEWRRLAKMVKDMVDVKVAQVDCQAHRTLCQQENVQSYPTIRLYPQGHSDSSVFHVYSNWYRDAPSLRAWLFEYLPSLVTNLDASKFHSEVLQSNDPWIVDFYAPWCGHCQVFAPEFEHVAKAVEGRVRAGKVNCDMHQRVCQQAAINAYPSVRFYHGSPQKAYGEDINSQNAQFIIEFLTKKVPQKKVKRASDEL
jgi:DnaJ family protein C protein 10